MTKKKYILKPGMHQFAPKAPPVHNNDNLTDQEAEWYIEKYPHIAQLFVEKPENAEVGELSDKSAENSENQIIEDPPENNLSTFQLSNLTTTE